MPYNDRQREDWVREFTGSSRGPGGLESAQASNGDLISFSKTCSSSRTEHQRLTGTVVSHDLCLYISVISFVIEEEICHCSKVQSDNFIDPDEISPLTAHTTCQHCRQLDEQ